MLVKNLKIELKGIPSHMRKMYKLKYDTGLKSVCISNELSSIAIPLNQLDRIEHDEYTYSFKTSLFCVSIWRSKPIMHITVYDI